MTDEWSPPLLFLSTTYLMEVWSVFLGATQEIILGFIYFNFEENSLLSLTSFGAFKYYPKKDLNPRDR